eukprot:204132_1
MFPMFSCFYCVQFVCLSTECTPFNIFETYFVMALQFFGKCIHKSSRLNCVLSTYKSTITYYQHSHFSMTNDIGKGERLLKLMDHYSDKPAGQWHELYHARIFFKEFFDDGCSSDEGKQFASNWCKMRAYICGMDGLSVSEKDAISTECNCWCPSISKDEFGKMCDIGANLSEAEADKVCDAVNETYPMESRRALLLNALCGASVDGLDIKEIEGFMHVAKKIGVDGETAQKIYSLYTLECELKQKYNEFYYGKST